MLRVECPSTALGTKKAYSLPLDCARDCGSFASLLRNLDLNQDTILQRDVSYH